MIRFFPSSYIVWDLETSGLDKENCHIIEAAAVVVRDGNIVEEWATLINNGIDIPEEARKINGITREMCEKEGQEPQKALAKLLKYINDAEVHVTHNGAVFDLPFLQRSLNRLGMAVELETLERSHIDTAALYKAHKLQVSKGWSEPWPQFFRNVLQQRVYGLKYNVAHVCNEFGISLENVSQHRALGDVTLTHKIYEKLVS